MFIIKLQVFYVYHLLLPHGMGGLGGVSRKDASTADMWGIPIVPTLSFVQFGVRYADELGMSFRGT